MKKQLLTLFLTFILAVVLAVTACAVELTDDSVFLKQETRTTCTLASATMMLRRKAIVDADANWDSITESAVRRVAWPGGLSWNFTYNGIHVSHKGKGTWAGSTLDSKRQALIQMLVDHPEGVVVYCSTQPHAMLLTDYDYNTGIFYCCDPAKGYPFGRVPLTSGSIRGGTQDGILSRIDQLWYVADGISTGAGTASWAVVEEDAPILARNRVQEVEINGETVRLELFALLDEQGNDVNYVKLRTLAQSLNGTPAQFNVGFDGAIALTTNTPYLSDSDNADSPFEGDQPYTVPTTATNVDGQAVQLDAIQLTDGQGGGHTYYNLRDLGKLLGYRVEWDPQAGIRIRLEDEPALDEIHEDNRLVLDD